MLEIIVESALGDQLGDLVGQVILRDPQGRCLGFFSPSREQLPVDDLQLEPLLSVAETEELRKVQTGKPLSDILGRLGIQ
jgi:hypothetical protein